MDVVVRIWPSPYLQMDDNTARQPSTLSSPMEAVDMRGGSTTPGAAGSDGKVVVRTT
jgi:hypothetical protein